MKYPISPEFTVTLHLSLALEDGTVMESTFEEACMMRPGSTAWRARTFPMSRHLNPA